MGQGGGGAAISLGEKEFALGRPTRGGGFLWAQNRVFAQGQHWPRWQCGTLQLDFSMPERLGAEYVAEEESQDSSNASSCDSRIGRTFHRDHY